MYARKSSIPPRAIANRFYKSSNNNTIKFSLFVADTSSTGKSADYRKL